MDWQSGFTLTEGADANIVWQYKFSQLRGSSDDGKSKLKLHFHDTETRSIDTKVRAKVYITINSIITQTPNVSHQLFISQELECQVLQSLLFCMHAFLTGTHRSIISSSFCEHYLFISFIFNSNSKSSIGGSIIFEFDSTELRALRVDTRHTNKMQLG